MYSLTMQKLVELISEKYSPMDTLKFLDDLINEIQIYPAQFITELRNAKYDYSVEHNLDT